MKKIAVDLDGTLCEEVPHSEKSLAAPIQKHIDLVNELYFSRKYTITIFSARGWPELAMTEKWLKDNGVMYHHIILGKYNYSYLWCDRSFNNPEDLLRKLNG